MLANLFVSDLALIRRLSVDFHRGFSVLTGETGAGKSLILDSLNLFLVQKGAKDLVRRGAEKLEVSLFFDEISPDARRVLQEVFSPEEMEEGITLTRTVTKEGKSTCKAGDRTLPFSKVSEMAKALLSIHGQNASGGLLEEKNHLLYLDSALPEQGEEILSEYRALYGEYTRLSRLLSELQSHGDDKEMLALYEYQMQEIAKVKPKAGEEEALEKRLLSLQNSEKRHGALDTADRALSGGEKGRGAVFLLEVAARKLEGLKEEEYKKLSDELYDLAHRAKEAAREVSFALSQEEEEDPAELVDRIRRRIDALYQLKLKYGSTVEEVIAFYGELKRKKDLTLSRKDDIKRTLANLEETKISLVKKADELSLLRKKVAAELEEQIHGVLSFLDMPKMRFFVSFEKTQPGPNGTDGVRFEISANTGEGVKPLAQVASGGELSRIMLALSLKLGKAKDADTLVFDEVDTGISGSTSQKIGIALRTLSQFKQIFCVTHSAQVATLSDHHFLVEKREEEGRTETLLSPLSQEDSLKENARLLGGASLTDKALSAAISLREEGLSEWKKRKGLFL